MFENMYSAPSSSFLRGTVGLIKHLLASCLYENVGIQSMVLPGLNAVSLEDVIVHVQPTKQRAMLVLLSVQGSVQITVDVEPRVL